MTGAEPPTCLKLTKKNFQAQPVIAKTASPILKKRSKRSSEFLAPPESYALDVQLNDTANDIDQTQDIDSRVSLAQSKTSLLQITRLKVRIFPRIRNTMDVVIDTR